MKHQEFFDDGRQAFLDGKGRLSGNQLSLSILISDDGIAKHNVYNDGWTKQMLIQPIEEWTDEENAALKAAQLANW